MGVNFNADISRWAGKTLDEVEDTRKKITTDFFSSTVMFTPVKTGALRANWLPSSGSPKFGISGATDKSGQRTIGKIRSQLAGGNKHKDQSEFMTNSLPYANKAETLGWKITSPYRMVSRSFRKTVNMIKARSLG
jgi:hypothetical protein